MKKVTYINIVAYYRFYYFILCYHKFAPLRNCRSEQLPSLPIDKSGPLMS